MFQQREAVTQILKDMEPLAVRPEDKQFLQDGRDFFTRCIGGMGLGLTIVKEIVKAHGGEIAVVFEEKKGSTFTVCFSMCPMVQDNEVKRF